jgi:leader peptidase (prepilin peptidase)/N-methyltransferase
MINYHFIGVIFFAWLISSVLNVVIYRLPYILQLKTFPHSHFKFYNLFLPRSHCPHCAKTIAWYHNIPIFSYIFLKGRCASCMQRIPWHYPIIEFSYTLMIALLYSVYPSPLHLIAGAFFSALLLIQACIDLELLLLPDVINYILLWSGLVINSFNVFCDLKDAVFGAVSAYLALWMFYHLYEKLTQKQGFGYGDFKFFEAIGAWLGIYKIFSCIFLSCVIGIIIGLIFALKDKKLQTNSPFPFGPALALAAYLLLLFPKLGISSMSS